MQVKDVTATTFGLVVAYLLPGVVALYALKYWSAPVADAFQTFLTTDANVGLFLFMLLGALILGLVVSPVRWLVYEVVLSIGNSMYGKRPTDEEWQRLVLDDRIAAFRATIDETYRYHQFFGGITVTAPLLFIGWLTDDERSSETSAMLIGGFVALELLWISAAIAAYKGYLKYTRAILAKAATQIPVTDNHQARAVTTPEATEASAATTKGR